MNSKDVRNIWEVPIYLPYLQPALTESMIVQCESKIGYRLPGEYISLLQTQNGGYIRYALRDIPHSLIAGIGPYFPSITDFEWLKEYKDVVGFNLDGLFPFDGDGHWNLCLDYRCNQIEPEVTYIDTESGVEQRMASSFREYLSLLTLESDGVYVLETTQSIQEAVNLLSQKTGIRFSEPDSYAHGYPIYQGTLKDGWIWVSPNKVRAAFIRSDEERYDELKHLMEASSLRYPEISATSLLIEFSDGIEKQWLFRQLTHNEIEIFDLQKLLDKNSGPVR